MGTTGSTDGGSFDQSILQDLPPDKKKVIEDKFREQITSYNSLNEAFEKLKTESGRWHDDVSLYALMSLINWLNCVLEQKYFQVENELTETQGDLSVQSGLCLQLKDQVSDLGNL